MPRKKKPKSPPRTPKYRLHKESGRAFVELNGRRIYIGDYESPETIQKYYALIAEWEANARTLPVPPEKITIAELLARFWEYAESYYKKPDGTQTSELHNYKSIIRLLREHYGHTSAAEFRPRALKAVRQVMVKRGRFRKSINNNVSRIRRIFRWGVGEELVPPSTTCSTGVPRPWNRKGSYLPPSPTSRQSSRLSRARSGP